jgi:hypothetical protein
MIAPTDFRDREKIVQWSQLPTSRFEFVTRRQSAWIASESTKPMLIRDVT